MTKFSERIQYLSDSPTLKLNDRINSLKNEGIDIINLTVGEPNYYEPTVSSNAAKKAIDQHFTHYTNSSGTQSLRKAICQKLLNENQLQYEESQITVSAGGKQALFNTFSVLINPEDEVIVPTPAWPSYEAQVRLVGGVPVLVVLDESTNFKLTPDILRKSITDKTKLLILNSPSNPTGSTYSKEELELLIPIIEENNLLVISDEIYERLVYGINYYSPAGLSAYMMKNTITVNGFSKAFGMTGWRIGYSAAPKEIASKISAFQSQITASISSISQVAAENAILNFDTGHVGRLKECRDLLISELATKTEFQLPNKPDGSFYLFPNINKIIGKTYFGIEIKDGKQFCDLLLSKVGVAITPGEFFGSPNNVRISYAKSLAEIQEAASRINQFFKQAEFN